MQAKTCSLPSSKALHYNCFNLYSSYCLVWRNFKKYWILLFLFIKIKTFFFFISFVYQLHALCQPAFTCSKSTMHGSTKAQYWICSKLTTKTQKRRNWRRSDIFIVNFDQISYIDLVFPLPTWTSKWRRAIIYKQLAQSLKVVVNMWLTCSDNYGFWLILSISHARKKSLYSQNFLVNVKQVNTKLTMRLPTCVSTIFCTHFMKSDIKKLSDVTPWFHTYGRACLLLYLSNSMLKVPRLKVLALLISL